MSDPRAERSALVVSTCACLVLGVTGSVFAVLTGADAILLDGMFNPVNFFVGLFTLRVASRIAHGDDERYAFFEPLENGIKGLLVLSISLMALTGAIESFLGGGSSVAMGWAVVYGVVATVVAWTAALWVGRAKGTAGSPLVEATRRTGS